MMVDEKTSLSEITADLFRRLRERNNGSGGIVLCEVGDGAGFRNRGWSDAISMQTWPSKKLVVTGYEVKATRSDWLRELDDPAKNEKWQKQCHEWYIVAPKGVVELPELPMGWGLLVPRGEDGLRIASRADIKTDRESVPLGLMAAVFRAADHERRNLEGIARREMREEAVADLADELERSEKIANQWREKFEGIAGALGSPWENLEKLKRRATAVRELENEHDDPKKLLRDLRTRLERTAAELQRVEDGL